METAKNDLSQEKIILLRLFASPFFSYPEFYLRSGVWGLALLGGAQVKPILKHFLFFLHQNVSPGRCPSWFKTGGGNVHFFHQDAQGESVIQKQKN